MAHTLYFFVMTGVMTAMAIIWSKDDLENFLAKVILVLLSIWSVVNALISMGFVIGA